MATYYWRGLTNPNWGTAGNWSTGSTSTLGGAVPTNADDTIFDVNSSGCTINITTAVCRSINFTAYTRTITFSNNLSIGVNGGTNAGLFLGPSMSFSGTGVVNFLNASGTLLNNGVFFPQTLNLGTSVGSNLGTITLNDDWRQAGNLGLKGATGSITINGPGNILMYGPLVQYNGEANGTTKLIFLSSTTFSGTASLNDPMRLSIEFSAGTNIVTLGNFNHNGGALIKYTSGIVTGATGTTVKFYGTSQTLDCGGVIFNDLVIPGSNPGNNMFCALRSDLNVAGNFYCSGDTRNIIYSGASNININLSGSCLLNGLTSGNFASNGPVFRFKGNGTFFVPNTSLGCTINSPISIEAGANTFTISGDLSIRTQTFSVRPVITYTSGVVDLTNHSNLTIISSTFNTAGITWKNVNLVTSTITFTSRFSATSITLTVAIQGLTLDGNGGFTTGSLSYTMQANTSVTLQNSVEYVINNSLFLRGTAVTNTRLTSSDSTLRTIFTLKESATQDVNYTTTTRLDSSSGQTIYTRYGTLGDTLNWQLLRNPVTKATSFLL